MPIQRLSNSRNSQIVFIGLDVHLKQWNVCIVHNGIRHKAFQQSPEVACLMVHLHRHYPDMEYYSAYEAGICGASIHYSLEAAGVKNIIFNAADIPQKNREKNRKTDAVDASKIARELANGELDCIHIPPQWSFVQSRFIHLPR